MRCKISISRRSCVQLNIGWVEKATAEAFHDFRLVKFPLLINPLEIIHLLSKLA
jgi:hypothetical protein